MDKCTFQLKFHRSLTLCYKFLRNTCYIYNATLASNIYYVIFPSKLEAPLLSEHSLFVHLPPFLYLFITQPMASSQ